MKVTKIQLVMMIVTIILLIAGFIAARWNIINNSNHPIEAFLGGAFVVSFVYSLLSFHQLHEHPD